MTLKDCHVCNLECKGDRGFFYSDCGEFTCNLCGDRDLCNWCLGDEIFLADILDLEVKEINLMSQLGRKEVCPRCGSKKIIINQDGKKICKVCKHEWKYSTGKKTSKKGKVRFR